MNVTPKSGFRCDIHQLDAHALLIMNGDVPSCLGKPNSSLPWQIYMEDDSLVIHVGKNIVIDKPVQLIFLCGMVNNLRLNQRIKIQMEEGSSMTLLHCIDSDTKIEASVSTNIDLNINKGAFLSWISLQNVNNNCSLDNTVSANVAENASLHTFFAGLNGGVLKNEQFIDLNGEYAQAFVKGLYLVDKTQIVGNKVKITHHKPNALSSQLFKGILDDSASGWFEGHVLVKKEAQKTQAFQTNRNMLLTPKAQFKTKPFLEIYADDVKCSHGATVGQLDENALFYMRCRGISATSARRLLMRAFTEEVIREVGVKVIETHLSSLVKNRLDGNLCHCDNCMVNCDAEQNFCNLPWGLDA